MNPNYQKGVKMFYCNAFALRRMCESLQCSAMDLHADKTNLTWHYMRLQGRIHVISLTRSRLFLFGFRRDRGKQKEQKTVKEGTYLPSFKAQTSF